jgi:hypothetical protein
MKFETIMLNSLFVVCVAVCALVMGSMLKASPSSVQLAGHSQSATVAMVAADCAASADAACPRINS